MASYSICSALLLTGADEALAKRSALQRKGCHLGHGPSSAWRMLQRGLCIFKVLASIKDVSAMLMQCLCLHNHIHVLIHTCLILKNEKGLNWQHTNALLWHDIID